MNMIPFGTWDAWAVYVAPATSVLLFFLALVALKGSRSRGLTLAPKSTLESAKDGARLLEPTLPRPGSRRRLKRKGNFPQPTPKVPVHGAVTYNRLFLENLLSMSTIVG